MEFVTLGMLIIDEIHHFPPTPPSYDILGGAGTFAALGARLFRPPPASRNVGWVVHRGYDFPSRVESEIKAWQSGIRWIDTPQRKTTRGWNGYVGDRGNEVRAFKFTSEKARVDETQLTPEMLLSKAFHMVCTPTRCISLVEGIIAARKRLLANKGVDSHPKPLFVWEPSPDACTKDALDDVMGALKHVHVLSPNHSELAALFVSNWKEEVPTKEDRAMEERCTVLLRGSFGEKGGAVVVRCGSRGCYIRSNKERRMLPAFYGGELAQAKVVDPTGAGNAFLGGFCIGMQSSSGELSALENAAVFGTVAASFAVEQVGLPELGAQDRGQELWNGDSVNVRLEEYMRRIQHG